MPNTFGSCSCAVHNINSIQYLVCNKRMEETTKREVISLINELIQGKELAKQLFNHLFSSSSSSLETNEFLIDKIILSYENALTMLYSGSNMGETKTTNVNMMDSHCSFTNESPRSEVMDHESEHKAVYKKRKTMPVWSEQVKICSRTGPEDDGYSWRKYGQKDILGAKFPRGYYRCTRRNVQGCLAKKQVQRSDEDPTIIEVTYRGRHTCTQAKHLKKASPSKIKMSLGEDQLQQQEKIEQTPEAIFRNEAELEEVKTEEDLETKEDIFPWFCFPSPSENEDKILFETMIEKHFMESFYPAFISPATSESDITEIVSAPTSVTNSPILDLDILLHKGDFDTYFPINTPEYFLS